VESAMVMSPFIEAAEEAPFVVRIPDPGNTRSFRVRFRSLRGATSR
jgi:hypothetical protein